MATKTIGGLKECYAGEVGSDGAAGTSLTKITQPYQGGVTITGTAPTLNAFYEENQAYPEVSIPDVTSGGTEVTWEVLDFDDSTLKFYFGEDAKSGIPDKSAVQTKTFRFDTLTGISLLIPRLQFVATMSGQLSASEPMRISVTGKVLAPKEGEMAIGISATPATTTTSEG